MKRVEKFIHFFKKHYVVILIILLLCLVFYYSYSSKGIIYFISNSDEDSMVQFVSSFGVFSYLIFIFLVVLEVVLAPIPALALYVAGGALFGTFLGSVLALIGNIIGAIIAFWIARKFGRNFVEKRIDPIVRKKFDNFSEKYGGFALFLLRVNPFSSSDIFSYISGLSNMRIRTFILGTGLGLIPMIFVQAYFGEAFVKTHQVLYAVLIWMSMVYLLVFVYLIWRTVSLKKKIIVEEPIKEKN